MRHTIVVRASPDVKNGQLAYHLPALQDGECLKLAQGERHIYVVYRVSESMSSRYAEVNSHLLALNGLDSDTSTTAEQVIARGIEHLIVEVSPLDWKIVNLNQLKIAESFLEQISIVWPSAQVPIYYQDSNFVVLKALCDRVSRLNINTTVEFRQKKEEAQEDKKEEFESQSFQAELILSNQDHTMLDGYINRITISNQTKKMVGLESNFWIIENQLQFAGLPTIMNLLEAEKQREKKKDSTGEQPNSKRLVLIQASEELKDCHFSCSKQSQELLALSQKIILSNSDQYKPKIQNLSLDLFLNDDNFYISIYRLQDNHQQSYLSPEQKSKMEEQWANHILNVLFLKKEFFVLQEAYPYRLHHSLYVMTLTHRKDKQISNKLYRLSLIGKDTQAKKEEYFKKITAGRIKLLGHGQLNSHSMFLHQHYALVSRWIKVIQENKNESKAQSNRENQQQFEEVFEAIYQDDIKKIYQFIESTSEKVCVVASYGSNGKSFLHEYLRNNGHRMWRVNFRQLNSPSLSFRDIDFYLEWIFANSPYATLFIDDFDTLCAKIDEGDHLRKREKTISQLLLRRINNYLKIYRTKVILTAKSQSSLDEHLAKHITIILKNPNREHRLKALTALAGKKESYSPIKKINLQEGEAERSASKGRLNEIVDATQSLTFGAFVKHAVSLTKPKDIKTTHIFDFTKIAGLKSAKATIKNIIEKPIKYSFLFKSVPIKLPRGILLYGGTGNGKSAIGAAVEDEFKMKYFSVKGSDILSKYIGGSEAAVRDIFEKALSVSPSIIFFDEFESIVPKRSANNTGVNDRIVNQFLCYLDGVSAISGVYIIAASSRPDLIDPAVLRPGRLDAHLFLDYPQPEEREELIKMFENSIKMEVEISQIVQKTAQFSYSDLIGLFKELRIKRSTQVLKSEHYSSEDFIKISRQLLEQTLGSFKLSVNPKEQKRQKKLYLNFQSGASPDIKAQKQIQY